MRWRGVGAMGCVGRGGWGVGVVSYQRPNQVAALNTRARLGELQPAHTFAPSKLLRVFGCLIRGDGRRIHAGSSNYF
jgi:hypothetical protein